MGDFKFYFGFNNGLSKYKYLVMEIQDWNLGESDTEGFIHPPKIDS